MARRRRRRGRSGIEAIFGLMVAAVFLTGANGGSLDATLSYTLWGLGIVVLVGFGIWFVKGLFESAAPIDLKTGKPKSSSLASARTTELPQKWTQELIDQLEWRVFEKLCVRLWEEKGFIAKETGAGADGGVDFFLYAKATDQKIGAVQCKSWGKKQIGVNVIRELQGVVAAEQLTLGLLMYSGNLSKSAKQFLEKPTVAIKSQGSSAILAEIEKLNPTQQKVLLQDLTAGDYTTPSCPNCDVKLVERTAQKTGKAFWSCSNFPRCRYTM